MTNSPFKRKFGAGYRLIFGYLSLFVSFAGLMLLLPLIMLIFYPEEYACYKSFLIPGAISIVVGLLLSFVLMKGEEKARLGKHQDSVLLCLIWILTVLLGSLPFYLSQFFYPEIEVIKMSFSESVFESVSGFSAAGLTVFRNLLDAEVAYGLNTFSPHVYLFYREIGRAHV